MVVFIAKVKAWEPAMGESVNRENLLNEFNCYDFLEQVWDHAKMIMEGNQNSVWLVQCLGIYWRAEKLRKALLPANIVILFAVDVTKVKCIYCCKILLQL
jgi:hypothetical protein